MYRTHRAAMAAAALSCALSAPSAAWAQSPQPLELTITANRTPTAIQRTGSAITVLRSDDITRSNPTTLADVLRQVPGVFAGETGGPGATSDIRLRGANPNQTLVLIDGVRVNDPAQANGEFDSSVIAPSLIDRIEVLRGPQSALYGSDAIGGVVNIITKRGRGQPSYSLGVEAGSHGTVSTVGSAAGAIGPWSFALSGIAQRSDGFSRYGHRIGRLAGANNANGIRGGGLEADGFERLGGYGRLGYDTGDGFRLDFSAMSVTTRVDLDAGSGLAVPGATTFPDTRSSSTRRFHQFTARAELDALGGALTHALQLSATRTDRHFRNATLTRPGGTLREGLTTNDFIGDRFAAEYQATARLQQFGTVIAGTRFERDTADTFGATLAPVPGPRLRTLAAQQDTASLFGLWQLPVGERLSLSFGGRYDKASDLAGVATWRLTGAYLIAETGTKLRASAGTGAKAPTLFQRFSPVGTADLKPESSLGFDVGIDQDFLNGRVQVSLTAFSNRFKNLIAFDGTPACLAQTGTRCYVNVDRASTAGLEASARVAILETLSATGSYTYLHAKDDATNLTLQRRPQHVGRFALQWNPIPALTIEPSVVLVSERFSRSGERDRLAPYARFDVAAAYRFNDTWRAHARIENIADARYQEVYNFGTTGRAFYAGLTATW